MNKRIRLSVDKLRISAYLYLAIPVIIFFLGWLRPVFGILCSAVLAVGLFFLIRDIINRDFKGSVRYIDISKMTLIVTVAAVMLWVVCSGIGGLVWQREDWNVRNATLRDLISYRWPVIFESGGGLVYFICFWMVPAVFGKTAALIAGEECAWTVANIALYIWSVIGILLVVLLLFSYFATENDKHAEMTGSDNSTGSVKKGLAAFLLILLICYGGINLLGQILLTLRGTWAISIYTVYSWSYYQYTPNAVLLEWVFNQTIPAWVGAMLYMHARREGSVAHFGMICMLLIPSAPFTAVGIVPLMIADIVAFKCRGLFSVSNIAAVISVLPVYVMYYACSIVAVGIETTVETGTTGVGIYTENNSSPLWTFCTVMGFCMIEVGIYALLIWRHNKKDYFFYMTVLWLFVIPFLKIGNTRDFLMRGSIIPLFVIMIYLAKEVIFHMRGKRRPDLIFVVLCICMLIGSEAVICDYIITAKNTMNPGLENVADEIKTNEKPANDFYHDGYATYLVRNAKDRPFFKYVAKQ